MSFPFSDMGSQQVGNFLQFSSMMPDYQLSDEDQKKLQERATEVGYKPESESFMSQITGLGKSFVKGVFSGFTTIPLSPSSEETSDAIAYNIGSLIGFMGIIPGPGLLGKLGLGVMGKTIGHTASKGLPMLSRVTSVPMWGANKIMEGISKVAPQARAIKQFGQAGSRMANVGYKAQDIIESGMHLGFASAIPSAWHGPEAMLYGFTWGAVDGAVFRGIANAVDVGSVLRGNNPAQQSAARTLVRTLSSSLYSGMAHGLEEEPVEMQVYHYLMGALFGFMEHPWEERRALQFIRQNVHGIPESVKNNQAPGGLTTAHSRMLNVNKLPEFRFESKSVQDELIIQKENAFGRAIQTLQGEMHESGILSVIGFAEGLKRSDPTDRPLNYYVDKILNYMENVEGSTGQTLQETLTMIDMKRNPVYQSMREVLDSQVYRDAAMRMDEINKSFDDMELQGSFRLSLIDFADGVSRKNDALDRLDILGNVKNIVEDVVQKYKIVDDPAVPGKTRINPEGYHELEARLKADYSAELTNDNGEVDPGNLLGAVRQTWRSMAIENRPIRKLRYTPFTKIDNNGAEQRSHFEDATDTNFEGRADVEKGDISLAEVLTSDLGIGFYVVKNAVVGSKSDTRFFQTRRLVLNGADKLTRDQVNMLNRSINTKRPREIDIFDEGSPLLTQSGLAFYYHNAMKSGRPLLITNKAGGAFVHGDKYLIGFDPATGTLSSENPTIQKWLDATKPMVEAVNPMRSAESQLDEIIRQQLPDSFNDHIKSKDTFADNLRKELFKNGYGDGEIKQEVELSKFLYSLDTVNYMKMVEVFNGNLDGTGIGISEIARRPGFISDAMSMNKRGQLFNDTNGRADTSMYKDLPTLKDTLIKQGGIRSVILSSDQLYNTHLRNMEFDDVRVKDGLLETRRNDGTWKKTDMHLDGGVFLHPEVFDAMVRDAGLNKKSGAIKASYGFVEKDSGLFFGKQAIFKADPILVRAMEKMGVQQVIFDTAAKQIGKRPVFEGRFDGIDWKFDREIPVERREVLYKGLEMVISGGQLGVDQAGLEAGVQAGFKVGGTAPQGYNTLKGEMPELLRDRYGLKESDVRKYWKRTKDNIRDSDGTLIFLDDSGGGTQLTIKMANDMRKPVLISNLKDMTVDKLYDFIKENRIKTINVAGGGKADQKLFTQRLTDMFTNVKKRQEKEFVPEPDAPVVVGNREVYDAKNGSFVVPFDGIRLNLSSSEHLESSLKDQHVAKQKGTNIDDATVMNYYMKKLIEPGFKGKDTETSRIGDAWAKNKPVDPFDIEDVHVQTLMDILYTDEKTVWTPERFKLYDSVVRQIMRKNTFEPEDFVDDGILTAEGHKELKELSSFSGPADHIIKVLATKHVLTPNAMHHTLVEPYWNAAVKNYVKRRATRPRVENSAKVILAPQTPGMLYNMGRPLRTGEILIGKALAGKPFKWIDEDLNPIKKPLGEAIEEYNRLSASKRNYKNKQKRLETMEHLLRFLGTRVPADSASGTRVFKVVGVSDQEGSVAHISILDQAYLGGADFDIDSMSIFQDIDNPANLVNGSRPILNYFDDPKVKYQWHIGNDPTKPFIDPKTGPLAEEFLVKPEEHQRGVSGLLSPMFRMDVHKAATQGNRLIGVSATFGQRGIAAQRKWAGQTLTVGLSPGYITRLARDTVFEWANKEYKSSNRYPRQSEVNKMYRQTKERLELANKDFSFKIKMTRDLNKFLDARRRVMQLAVDSADGSGIKLDFAAVNKILSEDLYEIQGKDGLKIGGIELKEKVIGLGDILFPGRTGGFNFVNVDNAIRARDNSGLPIYLHDMINRARTVNEVGGMPNVFYKSMQMVGNMDVKPWGVGTRVNEIFPFIGPMYELTGNEISRLAYNSEHAPQGSWAKAAANTILDIIDRPFLVIPNDSFAGVKSMADLVRRPHRLPAVLKENMDTMASLLNILDATNRLHDVMQTSGLSEAQMGKVISSLGNIVAGIKNSITAARGTENLRSVLRPGIRYLGGGEYDSVTIGESRRFNLDQMIREGRSHEEIIADWKADLVSNRPEAEAKAISDVLDAFMLGSIFPSYVKRGEHGESPTTPYSQQMDEYAAALDQVYRDAGAQPPYPYNMGVKEGEPIRGFQGENRFLSNFWNSPVVMEGIKYPTVEHAYQAAKTTNVAVRKAIAELDTPGKAKRMGREVTIRDGWDEMKTQVMYDLVKQKFSQGENFKELMKTGHREIVEENNWGDTFWGVSNGRGENHLGQIIMRVRSELARERMDSDFVKANQLPSDELRKLFFDDQAKKEAHRTHTQGFGFMSKVVSEESIARYFHYHAEVNMRGYSNFRFKESEPVKHLRTLYENRGHIGKMTEEILNAPGAINGKLLDPEMNRMINDGIKKNIETSKGLTYDGSFLKAVREAVDLKTKVNLDPNTEQGAKNLQTIRLFDEWVVMYPEAAKDFVGIYQAIVGKSPQIGSMDDHMRFFNEFKEVTRNYYKPGSRGSELSWRNSFFHPETNGKIMREHAYDPNMVMTISRPVLVNPDPRQPDALTVINKQVRQPFSHMEQMFEGFKIANSQMDGEVQQVMKMLGVLEDQYIEFSKAIGGKYSPKELQEIVATMYELKYRGKDRGNWVQSEYRKYQEVIEDIQQMQEIEFMGKKFTGEQLIGNIEEYGFFNTEMQRFMDHMKETYLINPRTSDFLNVHKVEDGESFANFLMRDFHATGRWNKDVTVDMLMWATRDIMANTKITGHVMRNLQLYADEYKQVLADAAANRISYLPNEIHGQVIDRIRMKANNPKDIDIINTYVQEYAAENAPIPTQSDNYMFKVDSVREWIREKYGGKEVTMEVIPEGYWPRNGYNKAEVSEWLNDIASTWEALERAGDSLPGEMMNLKYRTFNILQQQARNGILPEAGISDFLRQALIDNKNARMRARNMGQRTEENSGNEDLDFVHHEKLHRFEPSFTRERGTDTMPGYDKTLGAIQTYANQIIRAKYTQVKAMHGHAIIKAFRENSNILPDNPELKSQWVEKMMIYLDQSLGNSGTWSPELQPRVNEAINEPLSTGAWIWTLDSKTEELVKKLWPEKAAKINEFDEHGIQKKIRHVANMEARWNMYSLLASPKAALNDTFGGMMQTSINTGWRFWFNSGRKQYLEQINDLELQNMQKKEGTWEFWDRLTESSGAMESFITHNFGAKLTSHEVRNIGNILRKLSDVRSTSAFKERVAQDRELRTSLSQLKEVGMDAGSWIKRLSEYRSRRRAWIAHYLKARETWAANGYSMEWNDPWLIKQATKGVELTQFLYDNASKPEYMRSRVGSIFTRFQNWQFNAMRFRYMAYKEAQTLGFKKGTPEFDKFERMMLTDMFVMTLAAVFPASLFDATLPAPFAELKDTAELLFGEEDKEKLLQNPQFFAPVSRAFPPVSRVPIDAMRLLWTGDINRFLDYNVWTWVPFGQAMNITRKTITNPEYAIEYTSGFPLHRFGMMIKSAKDGQKISGGSRMHKPLPPPEEIIKDNPLVQEIEDQGI